MDQPVQIPDPPAAFDAAELGLRDAHPSGNDLLGKGTPVERVGAVRGYHTAHVPGGQGVPHAVRGPEFGRHLRRPHHQVALLRLARPAAVARIVTRQARPTGTVACAVRVHSSYLIPGRLARPPPSLVPGLQEFFAQKPESGPRILRKEQSSRDAAVRHAPDAYRPYASR